MPAALTSEERTLIANAVAAIVVAIVLVGGWQVWTYYLALTTCRDLGLELVVVDEIRRPRFVEGDIQFDSTLGAMVCVDPSFGRN